MLSKPLVFIKRIDKSWLILKGLGLVYLWFGFLKFFAGFSPAEELAGATISKLTLGLLDPATGLLLLAIWETGIGILLLAGLLRRVALQAALVHICCTFLPLIFFPQLCFTQVPIGLTLVGQYIVKNVVFLGIIILLLRWERPD